MTVKKPAASTPLWGEKPYRSLDYEWKKQYGEKIYKVSLNGGMTCPNRDGTVGSGGCIFCSAGGSGDFAADARISIREQIESQEEKLRTKFPAKHFVAYFQAYTNTYAPVDYLRKIFTEAITHPDIVALSIGTRPDCLPDDVLDLLSSLNEIKPVTIELGLQTIHEKTAAFIRRGYALPCFEEAVQKLRSCGISVVVHTILGLPGETEEEFSQTLAFLRRCDFAQMHIFPYSIRPGTKAAEMEQVPGPVKEERAARASAVAAELHRAYLQGCVGQTYPVLFEQRKDGCAAGHAPNYMPVEVQTQEDYHNTVRHVKITGVVNDILMGEVT